jgi:hypothetical protein
MELEVKVLAYQNFIKELSDKQSDFIYHNSGAEYASIVFSNIFRTANRIVRMHSRALSPKVTDLDTYLMELNGYLSRGGELKIILEDEMDPDSNISKILNNPVYKNQINILSNKGSIFHMKTNDIEIPVHIATADGRMYRVEKDIENHLAFGSFNDKTITEHIEELFDNKYLHLSA